MVHNPCEPRQLADVRGVLMCAFCVFLYKPVQLGTVHLLFPMDKIMHKQMLNLHYDQIYP